MNKSCILKATFTLFFQRMKRSLPPDFDPVYPYETPPLNIMPPFYSTDGFVEQPTSTLALKLGAGLNFDSDGALEATSVATNVQTPLEYDGALKLKTGDGLEVVNTALVVKTISPVVLTSSAVGLSTAAPLALDADNALTVGVSSPITINTNKLALETEGYFNVNAAGKLSLTTGNGLVAQNNALSAVVQQPLQLGTSGISLNATAPLSASGASLSLTTGDGLEVTSDTLKVKIGTGLSFSNGALTVSSSSGSTSGSSSGVYIYNYQLAFTWEITPTPQSGYYIYRLSCTGFAPQSNQSSLSFTPTDSAFIDFFDYIEYMYTVVQQINNTTVNNIPLRITYSNADNQLKLVFSSELTANLNVAPWTASVCRYQTSISGGASWFGPEW